MSAPSPTELPPGMVIKKKRGRPPKDPVSYPTSCAPHHIPALALTLGLPPCSQAKIAAREAEAVAEAVAAAQAAQAMAQGTDQGAVPLEMGDAAVAGLQEKRPRGRPPGSKNRISRMGPPLVPHILLVNPGEVRAPSIPPFAWKSARHTGSLTPPLAPARAGLRRQAEESGAHLHAQRVRAGGNGHPVFRHAGPSGLLRAGQ